MYYLQTNHLEKQKRSGSTYKYQTTIQEIDTETFQTLCKVSLVFLYWNDTRILKIHGGPNKNLIYIFTKNDNTNQYCWDTIEKSSLITVKVQTF